MTQSNGEEFHGFETDPGRRVSREVWSPISFQVLEWFGGHRRRQDKEFFRISRVTVSTWYHVTDTSPTTAYSPRCDPLPRDDLRATPSVRLSRHGRRNGYGCGDVVRPSRRLLLQTHTLFRAELGRRERLSSDRFASGRDAPVRSTADPRTRHCVHRPCRGVVAPSVRFRSQARQWSQSSQRSSVTVPGPPDPYNSLTLQPPKPVERSRGHVSLPYYARHDVTPEEAGDRSFTGGLWHG